MLSTLCLLLAPALATETPIQDTAKPAAPAAQSAAKSGFSYSWVQVDLVMGDGDGFSDGPDGFDLHGSYALKQKNLFVFGGISMLSGDAGSANIDFDTYEVGLGYHTPMNPITDLVFAGSLLLADTDTSADGGGWGLQAGMRHQANAQFELDGTLGVTDYSGVSSNVWLELGAIYSVSPQLGICATLLTSDDIDTLSLGVRYNL